MSSSEDFLSDESFRDRVGFITEDGKRKFIYPKKPSGKFYKYRTWLSYVLLTIFFTGPFIRINGQPFLMLNILERKFVILGQVFWPQDFHLVALTFVTGVVFIILFTVAYGRLFCGWVCPQTIFMEMLFRKIEYWIDGDRGQQLRLASMPWNAEKIRKRVLKNGIFYLISFIIGNVFLMYIIGSDAWIKLVSDDPSKHIGGLVAMIIFSGVFFFVFAWFREQVCIVVCPYGRLQGVLLDRNSIVIAYDRLRGEPRAKFRKNEDRTAAGKGDCIDCGQCVDVCPTGIDIRNGTQLECVNCTACIDACDAVMDKINKPRGLIKYASENQIANGEKWRFTGRLAFYTVVLTLLLGLMGFLIFSRVKVEATILRTPGQLYQAYDDGTISNVYNYQLINKTSMPIKAELRMIEPTDARIMLPGKEDLTFELGIQDIKKGAMFVYIPKEKLSSGKNTIKIGVFNGDELLDEVKLSFQAPIKK
ncbi:cytochrome c oxidase accessory protein CcoG [Thermaurantimonas aggregans]|uniref:Cytochrome c oxidase accessory protein CcoG n=1 Tax=Thermaurantimonas aggregans TaxID=2173829 RepID=A0A401XKE6_9FLAO|nr:cytochrome c oxidase accessory protein CcoG [Thermaurantimonas aggregans]MCX8148356.1 cytochrome c oxidase accessory protein CcoG [Thermaurantimonas aggregans]GCD77454.1 cytochrome c oxidase accessory protein CcoG [Thermaurantimonas aggregans]